MTMVDDEVDGGEATGRVGALGGGYDDF